MSTESTPRRAGGFDIRLIIALLLGFYGLVLLVMGIGFTTEEELNRADGLNINLWAGIGMLVATAVFVVWAKLRPLVVPPSATE
ncbi:hypothetical protein [Amycolatopsis sp. YIM 10]|uniref:hypothetical protein n=1 Tax=Amycolatopsis sp. YIM 10 TaxID=2653857 RepID=UPI0012906888|nr:hypothetical protein [Amycolatopsis sp. YIM 10]QFU86512.1 hypothetical protein YIM_06475 [Amycolatopsis sp. YIM 10]